MGIQGAAISTTIAYTIFSGLLFKDLLKGRQGFKLFKFSYTPDKVIFKSIFTASAIAALLPMMTNVVIYLMLRLMNGISPMMVDAFSLAKRFELYMIQLSVCLGASAMIVIGASHATHNRERVLEVLNAALKLLFWFGVPITLFMMVGSHFYYMTLTDKEAIISEGGRYFIYGSLNMLFTTGLILLNFCFQGLGRPALAIPYSLTSVILIQGLGGWYLLSNDHSSSLYYGMISLGTTITFFLNLRIFYKTMQKS
jgi:Na+-driven multidrug efflux pump